MHNGKAARGIAHPSYVTGKYTKDLPLQLAAAYQQARDDPDIHALTDEIALAEARLHELLTRLDTSDLGHAWLRLDAAWQTFVVARMSGDVAAMRVAFDQVEPIILQGKQDYLLWSEITDKIRLLGDLRLKEHRRLVDLQTMMTADKANLLFGLLQDAYRSALLETVDALTARAVLVGLQARLARIDTRLLSAPGIPGDGGTGRRPVARRRSESRR